eukprot:TRINITY_DN14197_c0_g2_i1.p1 TRINITY_DN14197_c0_g2~~TRINITY_DN14197_c0_g2_i1.p1  ORF type:complete len:407 (+),score=50.24 TRINITY_DN14197_c0_g2_i1:65-1285(+)
MCIRDRDYAPQRIAAYEQIEAFCQRNSIKFQKCNDILLTEKQYFTNSKGKLHSSFTLFFTSVAKYPPRKPAVNQLKNYLPGSEGFRGEYLGNIHKFHTFNPAIEVRGGRDEALKMLEKIGDFKDYAKERIFPRKPTTRYAPYLNYGCISVRELYYKAVERLGKGHDLIRQLYWRDFFTLVLHFHPIVVPESYQVQFRDLKWTVNEEWWTAWKTGVTGYPIVDAAMRQLTTTGYISNIMRMISANFLSKLLLIDWRDGEKFYGRFLLDYDVALNANGWQWSASTGYVSLPYNKVYDPRAQARICDPTGEYIKKWIPELESVPLEHIHRWDLYYTQYAGKINYPVPIVDFEIQQATAVKAFEYYEQRKRQYLKGAGALGDEDYPSAASSEEDDEWSHDIEDDVFEEVF